MKKSNFLVICYWISFYILFSCLLAIGAMWLLEGDAEGQETQQQEDQALTSLYEPVTDGTSSSFGVEDSIYFADNFVADIPTQQVCLDNAHLENPLSHNSLHLTRLCLPMRGTHHWIQYWPLSIQAANEYGDIVTLVQYYAPGVDDWVASVEVK